MRSLLLYTAECTPACLLSSFMKSRASLQNPPYVSNMKGTKVDPSDRAIAPNLFDLALLIFLAAPREPCTAAARWDALVG
jgi:hypothetical protein